jgi:hypothetical protein
MSIVLGNVFLDYFGCVLLINSQVRGGARGINDSEVPIPLCYTVLKILSFFFVFFCSAFSILRNCKYCIRKASDFTFPVRRFVHIIYSTDLKTCKLLITINHVRTCQNVHATRLLRTCVFFIVFFHMIHIKPTCTH